MRTTAKGLCREMSYRTTAKGLCREMSYRLFTIEFFHQKSTICPQTERWTASPRVSSDASTRLIVTIWRPALRTPQLGLVIFELQTPTATAYIQDPWPYSWSSESVWRCAAANLRHHRKIFLAQPLANGRIWENFAFRYGCHGHFAPHADEDAT